MPTPVSSATPYCTGAQFIQFYDVRWIGDRLADLGLRVTSGNVASDPNLAQFLLAASGEIEAALYIGTKYQPADLQALTGASQALLIRLCADLTALTLHGRRPDNTAELPPRMKKAVEDLKKLESGKWIFGLQEKGLATRQIKVYGPGGQKQPLGYTPVTQQMTRLSGDTTQNNGPF